MRQIAEGSEVFPRKTCLLSNTSLPDLTSRLCERGARTIYLWVGAESDDGSVALGFKNLSPPRKSEKEALWAKKECVCTTTKVRTCSLLNEWSDWGPF